MSGDNHQPEQRIISLNFEKCKYSKQVVLSEHLLHIKVLSTLKIAYENTFYIHLYNSSILSSKITTRNKHNIYANELLRQTPWF